ncbi:uncharacterized protein LOC111129809 isoform X2 [Crassostrea virginica]
MVKPGVNVKVTWILCFLCIRTNEAAKCLQDAQRQCQDQSAGLIEARQGGEVCRAYADYDSCIKTSINKLGCRLLPSEADLHETDITNVYTRPPYGCTKTDSGWIALWVFIRVS